MSCAGQAMKSSICFQGHSADKSRYLYIQSLYVAQPSGCQLILPLCSEVTAQT